MTSSLVGSEMCIRDSDDSGREVCRRAEEVFHQLNDGGRHDRNSRRRQAVSYTHLTLPTICSV
eukprot:6651139-Prorocentrum_lima.AAC.1